MICCGRWFVASPQGLMSAEADVEDLEGVGDSVGQLDTVPVPSHVW